jgi:ABC-2 type transport system permease protein
MKCALLVAAREYAENVKTKGFWVGVILMPILMIAGVQVPRLLRERATPTRYFALVDQSGELGTIVDAAVERHHARRVMRALAEHARKHAKAAAPQVTAQDLERMPAPDLPSAGALASADLDKLLDELSEQEGERLGQFTAALQAGRLADMLAPMTRFLKPDAPPFEEPRRMIVRVPSPADIDANAPAEQLARAARPYLLGDKELPEGKRLFSFAIVPKDVFAQVKRPGLAGMAEFAQQPSARGVEYWAANLADTDIKDLIRRAINEEVRRREYGVAKIDDRAVKRIEGTSVRFTDLDPKKEAGQETVSMADTIRQWAPSGFVYLLFTAIMTVAVMLLNNTVEEKSNRIIEVLLSSVTPGELMTGKLLGIAGVGLTLVVTWVLSILLVLNFMAGPETEWAGVVLQVVRSSGLLGYFLVYFVLGYLLYAGLFLAIGSLCSTIKDAQNFQAPIILLMMVPMFLMFFIPRDPNGTLATITSWVPLWTPFVMMNRAAADPPTYELVGTTLLLLVTTVLTLWMSGKVFRMAILRTGQPPKWLQVLKWLRG